MRFKFFFLLFLSNILLLVWRIQQILINELIFYPAILQNSFITSIVIITSNSFYMESLVFFLCILSCYLHTMIVSPLPFQSEYLFFSFILVWLLCRTSNTKVNRSGESGHPCLVPEFSRKAFSFSLLRIILAMFLKGYFYVGTSRCRLCESIFLGPRLFLVWILPCLSSGCDDHYPLDMECGWSFGHQHLPWKLGGASFSLSGCPSPVGSTVCSPVVRIEAVRFRF